MFVGYGFCIITFMSKSLAWGYIFSCIKSMLTFTGVESDPIGNNGKS